MKTELLKKYQQALVLAENIDELGCHILGIKRIIERLKTEEPTTTDIAWVDYFLEHNTK